MMDSRCCANLVLGGGGIKGIAYAGVFESAERMGFRFKNIAGVSAGALAGSLKGAGYNGAELKRMLYEIEFGKIKTEVISTKVPVVERFNEYYGSERNYRNDIYKSFLNLDNYWRTNNRSNFFKNIINYCKDGCLFDGDFIEAWVYKELLKKGVRTFADFRKKEASCYSNPRGYIVRMTAVDLNRGRVIVLPDDIDYYGVEPDELEVAKAVRMSTSVPFAFKPVEICKKVKGETKKHYIVDGGVIDNLPLWLAPSPGYLPLIGCKLDGGHKKKIFNPSVPLNVLKGLISAVHDVGIPKSNYKYTCIMNIDTHDISFLDFDISDSEKEMLFESGWNSAMSTFNKLIQIEKSKGYIFSGGIRRILGFMARNFSIRKNFFIF